MRRVLTLGLLIALAGCSEAAEPTSESTPDDTGPAVIEAPTWAIGDWWTYRLGGDAVTWVVTEELGDVWIVDVDGPDIAFAHEAFAQVSTIGDISKRDLDGTQENGPVHFFDFPLEQNKTWSLDWDGTTWQAQVTGLVDGTAEIQATSEAGLRVYIYDNSTKWFRSMAAYDVNETLQFEVELDRSGAGYSGPFVRWTVHSNDAFSYTPGQASLDTFDVPGDATDIWYQVRMTCNPDGLEGDQGAGVLEVHPGEGDGGLSYQETCPVDIDDSGTMAPQSGEWGITAMSGGAAIDATFIPRTLHEYSL